MSQFNHQKSIHKMQRYVLGGVALLSAMGLSFPIAMARVSATKQFPGQSVKSQDCANQTLKESKVIEWVKDCAPLKVEPKKADTKSVQPALPEPVAAQPVAARPVSIESLAPIKSSIQPELKPDSTPELKPTPKTSTSSLQLGSSGDLVIVLQEQLQLAGIFSGAVDGIFGIETELAVQDLQQSLKLEPSGIADTQVQTALKLKAIDR